jgi:imidazolonepropionase-like amidohydrolase
VRARGLGLACGLLILVGITAAGAERQSLREVNDVPTPSSGTLTAIVGARLVDGRGGPAVPDSVVLLRGSRIAAAGPRSSVRIPPEAARVDAAGLTVLPGFLDSHFHLDGDYPLPGLVLSHGVTSVRDPGAWIEAYEPVRKPSAALPRLFLCGPHLDSPPPAYPEDARIVRDAEEARRAVERQVAEGASAIKAYFRLPLGLIRVVTETAHRRGVPVTAHLETVDAGDAIRVGLDGIEHVTSLGTALAEPREAERYRQSVLADNNARREGRYQLWSRIDPDGSRAQALYRLMRERRVVLSPTLAVFERRAGDRNTTDVHVRAFQTMLAVVGRAHRAGVPVVAGSHSHVPHAETGWAYQRELELLAEAGLTPAEAIQAATSVQARFFGASERIGTVEPGKLADLLLLRGDPTQEIAAARRIERVMLNGRWVSTAPGR